MKITVFTAQERVIYHFT